jgi:hypothetical protein
MFAGHVGAGLLLGRGARAVNAGVFIAAALLPDLLLWMFVLLGWEDAFVPPDFRLTHQARFVFPWSHGLLASATWALLAATVAWLLLRLRRSGRAPDPQPLRAAALVAAAVMSHWLLDALVHAPELPVAGPGSAKLGLGLWQHMGVALALESLLVVAGLWLYLRGSGWSRARMIALSVLCLVLLAFTILGLTVAPPPPSVAAMAASSLITLVVVCGLALWLGRRPRETIAQ